MQKLLLGMLIVTVPFAFIGNFLGFAATMMFIVYSLAIVSLASYIGRATESLAIVSGPRIGGLLNVTFGNVVELTISVFALKAGFLSIVLASLTGAVISNLLLVAGLSFFIGGLKYKRQKFNIFDARHNAGLLMFCVVLSFVFPAVFASYLTEAEIMTMSVWIAVIMLILYFALLYFKLVSHRGVYAQKSDGQEDEEPEWNKKKAIIILASAAIAVAFISDMLVDTFEVVGETFGWTELFIGVIIVAIIGNSAENITAILMAFKNKMNISVEIAIGSTLQIAMFVTPLLVLLSLLLPVQMPLLFSMPALVAMVLSVFLSIFIFIDGDTNWFEGLILLAAYLIIGIGFYLI
ncbi:calcium/proton exchanger [Desulfuribacillus alkaliarsenatis]|uniref:calcium/proton exchanger n=1 Tax=Desulfuribacillus alkaliarsenatis TaxID=766136 RepID=UPI0009FC6929